MRFLSGTSIRFLSVALAGLVSWQCQAANQRVGHPGGNVLLSFVYPGSHGLQGALPTAGSWFAYAKDNCPTELALWSPKKAGQFCAANAAARTFAASISTLCDRSYAAQCRLVAGKYVAKGIKGGPKSNARFWYFDGINKIEVNVSAKSDRASYSVGRYANGADMGGNGGVLSDSTCAATSDEFNYNDPREVPDFNGHPQSFSTVVVSSTSGTIFVTCAD